MWKWFQTWNHPACKARRRLIHALFLFKVCVQHTLHVCMSFFYVCLIVVVDCLLYISALWRCKHGVSTVILLRHLHREHMKKHLNDYLREDKSEMQEYLFHEWEIQRYHHVKEKRNKQKQQVSSQTKVSTFFCLSTHREIFLSYPNLSASRLQKPKTPRR